MSESDRPTAKELALAGSNLLHAQRLGFDITDPAVQRILADTARREAAENSARKAAEDHSRLEATKHAVANGERIEPESVVYYMRVGDRVKIGYTSNLKSRVAQVMPEEVLATEPGGRLMEGVRHRQFADLRVAREWFRLEGRLDQHIARLREAA